MIYIFTALYCEAHTFIKRFGLKRNLKNTHFQEFYSGTAGIRLTVTGVGEIAAAAAVGSVCTAYKPAEEDVLLNIGTCAHVSENDGIFLCNKIVEQATGRTFYPDVLYRHDFCEAAVVTNMVPLNAQNGDADPAPPLNEKLFDMEAAAVYQAGAYFFGPHQMFFLKAVSDRGTAKEVSSQQVEQLMETYGERICGYISLLQAAREREFQGNVLQQEEEALAGKLCADMHCSKVMEDSVRQFIHYLSLAGVDYKAVIQELYQKNVLPCKDKREGKLCLEELKRRLL